MKRIIYAVLVCIAVISCKKGDEKNHLKNAEKKEVKLKSENDKRIDRALEEGLFVSNEHGVDMVLFEHNIFLIEEIKTDEPSNFFLHVMQEGMDIQKLDFLGAQKRLDKLNKYKNFNVYELTIPDEVEFSKSYRVNFGKIVKGKGRIWNKYIFSNKIKKSAYDNRYLENIASEFYDFDIELNEAFDHGYFIKRNSGFDLLYYKDYLYFIKKNGKPEDLENRFFLHCKLEGTTEISNLDFNFDQDKITSSKYPDLYIARRILPQNSDSFATGQSEKDLGRIWSVSYKLDAIINNNALIYDNEYDNVKKE